MEDDSKPKYALNPAASVIASVHLQNAEAIKRLSGAMGIGHLASSQTVGLRAVATTAVMAPTLKSIAQMNRQIIGASGVTESLASIARAGSIAQIQPNVGLAIAEALRPAFAINTALVAEALRPAITASALLAAEALRPSSEMVASYKAITAQIVGMSDTALRISAIAQTGSTLASVERLGSLVTSYAAYAEVASEELELQADDELATTWIFIRWYAGLSRRNREILLVSLIALMAPLLAFTNTYLPERQQIPERAITGYELIAGTIGLICFIRSTLDD